MELFLTGSLMGTNVHLMTLTMMGKSYSHKIFKLFKC